MERNKVMATVQFEDGAFFKVDFEKRRLVDCDDPENVMLLENMKDTGKGYEFIFDPGRKNMISVPEDFVEKDTGPYLVKLKYLTGLHPNAMSAIFNVPVERIAGKTDKEFFEMLEKIKRARKRVEERNRPEGKQAMRRK